MARPPKIRWTRKRLTMLGVRTDSEIARLTGLSQPAVHAKRKSLGIPPAVQPGSRPKRAAYLRRRKRATELRALGLSYGEIAKIFGLTDEGARELVTQRLARLREQGRK